MSREQKPPDPTHRELTLVFHNAGVEVRYHTKYYYVSLAFGTPGAMCEDLVKFYARKHSIIGDALLKEQKEAKNTKTKTKRRQQSLTA